MAPSGLGSSPLKSVTNVPSLKIQNSPTPCLKARLGGFLPFTPLDTTALPQSARSLSLSPVTPSKVVDTSFKENEECVPTGNPTTPPKQDRDAKIVDLAKDTRDNDTPPSSPTQPRIVGKKILLPPNASPTQPKTSHASAFRRQHRTTVDKMLSHTPSIADNVPYFRLKGLRRGPRGAQSKTYFAELESGDGKPASGRGVVFVKVVAKNEESQFMKSRSELQAYRRLIESSRDGKKNGFAHFVLHLEAFVDLQGDDELYIFDVCQSDLMTFLRRPDAKGIVPHNLQLWMAQGLAAISHLHSIGIVHRDIKTENILIDYKYNVRVTDLGFAWVSTHQQRIPPGVKCCHRWLGTPLFMAPEVVGIEIEGLNQTEEHWDDLLERKRSLGLYGPSADYWGFGMVCFEMAGWKIIERGGDITAYTDAIMRSWKAGNTAVQREFLADCGIEETCADAIVRMTDPDAETRAEFNELYFHPFFQEEETGRSIFERLYSLSVRRREHAHPSPSYKRFQTPRVWHIRHMQGEDRVSWINPSSRVFDFDDL